MKAKFKDIVEFEEAMDSSPLTLFGSSGNPSYGAYWKRYKTGDPVEDNFGDISTVVRRTTFAERLDYGITRFDKKMDIYKNVNSVAEFKVNSSRSVSLHPLGNTHTTLFEMVVDCSYTGGIDPI